MLAPSDSAHEDEGASEGLARDEASAGRTYSDAALVQYQPRLTCVIPKRVWAMLLVLVGGIAAIAGIEALYGKVLPHVSADDANLTSLLDPTSRGSLASWFASLTLFTGALSCLLVYSIRQHRLDDYRGRYRVWLWAAAAFCAASLDAATGAHQILTPLLVQVCGTTIVADGAIWGAIVTTILFAPILTRVAVEVWTSRAATSVLAVSALAYVASIVYAHHPSPGVPQQIAVLISTSALMTAHFGLVYAVVCFARHVYLEAQGERRSQRAKQPATAVKASSKANPKARATKARTTKPQSVRVDSAHEPKAAPAKKQPVAAPAKKRVVATSNPDPEPQVPMSKAERRRLRKLERRQKRHTTDSDV